MNILVCYYGQPRQIDRCLEVFNQSIYDTNHTFKICYTTWKNEDISKFQKLFPLAHIRQVDKPDILENPENFKIDPTNACVKNFDHYAYGIYVKQQIRDTILEVEKVYNTPFDLVIISRTDTLIWDGNMKSCFSECNDENIVCVGHSPRFDIYRVGAVPDVCYFGKRNTVMKSLLHYDNIKHGIVPSIQQFHPESSLYLMFKYFGFQVKYCSFKAFPKWEAC